MYNRFNFINDYIIVTQINQQQLNEIVNNGNMYIVLSIIEGKFKTSQNIDYIALLIKEMDCPRQT